MWPFNMLMAQWKLIRRGKAKPAEHLTKRRILRTELKPELPECPWWNKPELMWFLPSSNAPAMGAADRTVNGPCSFVEPRLLNHGNSGPHWRVNCWSRRRKLIKVSWENGLEPSPFQMPWTGCLCFQLTIASSGFVCFLLFHSGIRKHHKIIFIQMWKKLYARLYTKG